MVDVIKYSGLPMDEKRLQELLSEYKEIYDEIAKLKNAHLEGVSPVVVFDPARFYKEEA